MTEVDALLSQEIFTIAKTLIVWEQFNKLFCLVTSVLLKLKQPKTRYVNNMISLYLPYSAI